MEVFQLLLACYRIGIYRCRVSIQKGDAKGSFCANSSVVTTMLSSKAKDHARFASSKWAY